MKKLYGFGTHRLKGEACILAVTAALKCGYNLIDTAEKYNNSVEIGQAIKLSKKKRNKITIVHKLTDVDEFSRTQTETLQKVEMYLKELDTDYLDILLMHGPSPRYHTNPEQYRSGNIEVYKAMIKMKKAGILKAIGISNYNKEQIMYLIEATGVIPDYLEVEYNVLNAYQIKDFKTWLDTIGIKVIGYSPLAEGRLNEIRDYMVKNGIKVKKNVAEYALRFCISEDVIPIPRSSNKHRIKQNLKSLKKGSFK